MLIDELTKKRDIFCNDLSRIRNDKKKLKEIFKNIVETVIKYILDQRTTLIYYYTYMIENVRFDFEGK